MKKNEKMERTVLGIIVSKVPYILLLLAIPAGFSSAFVYICFTLLFVFFFYKFYVEAKEKKKWVVFYFICYLIIVLAYIFL